MAISVEQVDLLDAQAKELTRQLMTNEITQEQYLIQSAQIYNPLDLNSLSAETKFQPLT